MVEQKPIDDIQIKEITAEAGVSYPVFFRQFTKKEEILNEIAVEEVQNLLAYSLSLIDHSSRTAGLTATCAYVDQHRTLWTCLLTSSASVIMRAEFLRMSEEVTRERDRASPFLPADLTGTIVVNGIFEVLTWWMRQPPDYPIEKIVWLMRSLVVDPVYRFTDIGPG